MSAEGHAAPIGATRTRPAWLESFAGQFLALLASFGIALLAGSLLIIAYGENPIDVYASIFDASLGSADGIGYVLAIATPLIFAALAVSVCFKGGLFNIGVEGQYLVAMITAAVAELNLDFLPGPLLIPAVLLAAMIGGMIWAAVPGILKVRTGAHEVVTTIMMNGIAISLVGWALNGPLHYNDAPEGAFVDLRSNVFPAKGLAGDLGAMFGVTPGGAPVVVAVPRDRGGDRRVVPDPANASGLRGPGGRLVARIGQGRRRVDRRDAAAPVPDLGRAGRPDRDAADPGRPRLPAPQLRRRSRVHGDRRGLPGPEQPDRHHLRRDLVGDPVAGRGGAADLERRCRASSSSSCRGC